MWITRRGSGPTVAGTAHYSQADSHNVMDVRESANTGRRKFLSDLVLGGASFAAAASGLYVPTAYAQDAPPRADAVQNISPLLQEKPVLIEMCPASKQITSLSKQSPSAPITDFNIHNEFGRSYGKELDPILVSSCSAGREVQRPRGKE